MTDILARPAGWPDRLPPPGAAQWERWAIDYLYDCCPPDFRRHAVLRRFPVVLAWFARRFVEGQEETSRRVLPDLRSDLSELTERLPPAAVEEAVEAWQAESAALARTLRAVRAIENALRASTNHDVP